MLPPVKSRRVPHHVESDTNVMKRRGLFTVTEKKSVHIKPKIDPDFQDGSNKDPLQVGGKYQQWNDSISHENAAYHSAATWAEIILRQVLSETQHQARPNGLRTAVCCIVLDKISSLFGRFDEVMALVKEEIFESIYVGYKRDGSIPKITNDSGDMSDPGVECLQQRQTFFQLARNVAARQEKASGSKKAEKVIANLCAGWTNVVKRLVFRGWCAYTRSEKETNRKFEEEFSKVHEAKTKHTLKVHFQGWRSYISDSRARRGVDPSSVVHKDIMLKAMSLKIEELEKSLADVNERYSSLLTSTEPLRRNVEKMLVCVNKYRESEKLEMVTPELESPMPQVLIDPSVVAANITAIAEYDRQVSRRKLLEVPLSPDPPRTKEEIMSGVHEVLAKPPPQLSSRFLSFDISSDPNDPSQTQKAKSPTNNASTLKKPPVLTKTPHYRSVIDWLNVRITGVSVPGLKRVRNLTTDFKNGEAYAALLYSLGSPKLIFEEVWKESEHIERAKHIIRYAQALMKSTLKDMITPEDIAHARGQNAQLLFLLFENFGATRFSKKQCLQNFFLKNFDITNGLVMAEERDDDDDDDSDDNWDMCEPLGSARGNRIERLSNREFLEWYNRLGCLPEAFRRELDAELEDADFEPEKITQSPEILKLGDIVASFMKTDQIKKTEKKVSITAPAKKGSVAQAPKLNHEQRKEMIMQSDRFHPSLVWFNKVLFENKVITAPVLTFEQAFAPDGFLFDFLQLLVPGSAMEDLKSVAKRELRAKLVEKTMQGLGIRSKCIPAFNMQNLDLARNLAYWKEIRQQYQLILSALYAKFCKISFPLM